MNLKFKIMNRQPEVSDEEVKSYMDFDKLLLHRNRILHKHNLFLRSGIVVLAIATLLSTYFFILKDRTAPQPATESTVVTDVPGRDPAMTSAEAEDGTEISLGKREEETEGLNVEGQTKPDAAAEVKAEPSNGPQVVPESAVDKAEPTQKELLSESVYHQAEPLNGYDHLFQYFHDNLSYPTEALTDSIQGVVTVSFVITAEGTPSNITIEKSLGEPFDKEALKLVQEMPSWKPATLNGKPVRSKVSLPLNFELRKINP